MTARTSGSVARSRVDSLEVIWPDGRYQLLTGLDVDRLLIVKQSDATRRSDPASAAVRATARPICSQPLDAGRGLDVQASGRRRRSTTAYSRSCPT